MKSKNVPNLQGGLVLAFDLGDKIVIDTGEETVVVTLIETKFDRARLHFNAPKSVVVDRLSIWQKKNPGMVQPGLKEGE